jgi:hypothetical protein
MAEAQDIGAIFGIVGQAEEIAVAGKSCPHSWRQRQAVPLERSRISVIPKAPADRITRAASKVKRSGM